MLNKIHSSKVVLSGYFLMLEQKEHSFFVRIIKLWNELPSDIVEADSFQHFKSKLKSYLNI